MRNSGASGTKPSNAALSSISRFRDYRSGQSVIPVTAARTAASTLHAIRCTGRAQGHTQWTPVISGTKLKPASGWRGDCPGIIQPGTNSCISPKSSGVRPTSSRRTQIRRGAADTAFFFRLPFLLSRGEPHRASYSRWKKIFHLLSR